MDTHHACFHSHPHAHAPCTSHRRTRAFTQGVQRHPVTHVHRQPQTRILTLTLTQPHTLTHWPSHMPADARCTRSPHVTQADSHIHVRSVHTCVHTYMHTAQSTHTHPFTYTCALAHTRIHTYSHTRHVHIYSHLLTTTHPSTHSHTLSKHRHRHTHASPHVTTHAATHGQHIRAPPPPHIARSHTHMLHTGMIAHSHAHTYPHHRQAATFSPPAPC